MQAVHHTPSSTYTSTEHRGTPWGAAAWQHPLQSKLKKNNRYCKHNDIKRFVCFTFQVRSATETG